MSDSDSPRVRHREAYRRDDHHKSSYRDADRKRHRSRSASLDRSEQYKHRRRGLDDSPRVESRYETSSYESKVRRERVSKRDESDDDTTKDRRRRRQRSDSRGERRPRRQRSASQENNRDSRRLEDDRQLVRSRYHRESSRDRRRHRRHSSSRESPRRQKDSPPRRARGPLPSQQDAFSSNRGSVANGEKPPQEKQKPNYGTSGKLAAETNTVTIGGEAILLKYHEPPEARKPPSSQAWRMYEFKGENATPLSTTELGTRSCWLFGRETAVVDFLIEHPSCSKQHAVIQFRYAEKRSEFGDKIGSVKPYVLDLESANGVLVNGERIPDRRYIELKSGDSVAFGESTRDYVVLLPPKEKLQKQ